ncbi:MAG: response regulator [Ardenticatenaceae bacterium]|nr:response regulator [Ardenticatenaceae bacterium]
MSKPLRVLIIEDSLDDVELLLRTLRRGDYDPIYERVEDAAAMQFALIQNSWDIVLSDYSMPHFSAPDALSLLQKAGLDLPFIIISGTVGEAIAVSAMKSGAHDFFVKGKLTRLVPAIERELRDVKVRRERAQAERRLQQRERYFRALIENVSEIIVTLDALGQVSYVSPAITRILGFSPDEFEGSVAFEMLHPDDRREGETRFALLLQNPRMNTAVEFRAKHKDGSWRWLEAVSRRVMTEPGVEATLIVMRDITERKRAEDEREQLMAQVIDQAKKVQFIVDTVPEGILLLSNGDIQLTNPVAKEYLSVLAPDWQERRLTHLGERPLNSLLTSPPKGLWHELESNDRFFEIIAQPVEDGSRQRGWVFVLRDVTRERQVQHQVQTQERLAAVGQLAAGIAHDFNNSLAVIKLYADILMRTTNLEGKNQEKLQVISSQTRRAADLIEQILDFGRQSVMERHPLDLLPFFKELTKLLRRTLPENMQINLQTDGAAEFTIYADPSRIQQAMLNLAFNARDAMPQGGHLRIGLKKLQLERETAVPISGMLPGEWVQLTITDTGSGISPELLDHVFEPFMTTKERGKGTGLGLSQVYGIVQQHDGFIDVTSAVQQGATFQLYFPVHTVGKPTFPQKLEDSLPSGNGQLILVVEDEEAIRMAMTESLTLLNYRVLEAKNGRKALPLLEEHSNDIDLVISDIIMPEMGGIDLFHALRERDLDIPFVLTTGYAVEKDMENLRAMGLYGWLAKPLNLDKLAQLLHQALS